MHKALTINLILTAAIVSLLTIPVDAKIRCKGSYQIIPGTGLHASPYCEIKNLANVARGAYGISTSFQRLRNKESEREDVCRAIGYDHRVYSICSEYHSEGGTRRSN